MKHQGIGSLWMLVAAFFFACMGVMVKIGAQKFSSNELVFYRSLFGLIAILAITRSGRSKTLATPYLNMHLTRSLLGFAALTLFFYAIGKLPLATAVTLNYTSPLFLAALTLIFLKNEARPVLYFTIFTGFVGVALLLQPTFAGGHWLAALLGLASGLLAGIVYLQVTQLGRLGEPEWRTVFYFTLVSAVISGAWMLGDTFHVPSALDWLALIAMGTCATLAQLAMTRAYRKGNMLVSGSLSYATVLLASLIGIVLWNETLSVASWIGIALIVLSGVISVRNAPLTMKSLQNFDK